MEEIARRILRSSEQEALPRIDLGSQHTDGCIGRFLKAEGLLQKFVEYEPHNAFAWLMLGSVLVQQDR